MPKINLGQVEQVNRTGYPAPFDRAVAGRFVRRLGAASGLTEIGVSQVVLEPGAWSSQRHWHSGVDEFLVMTEGEAVLIEDQGETVLRAGDCAAFPKDVANGHHLVNRSDRPCAFIVVDNRRGEGDADYPDIDLKFQVQGRKFTRKDGSSY